MSGGATGTAPCNLCGGEAPESQLAESAWVAPEVERRVQAAHPGWRRGAGACPACVQHYLLEVLSEKGEVAYHQAIQRLWPLDSEAAYGALPTPLRMHASPKFGGRGVSVAVVDAGFYPHPDLTQPFNRIRAWADAATEPVVSRRFGPDEAPAWPGWDAREAGQWHGLMTSTALAGNGWSSHGLYRGLAPEAELVLVQVRDAEGRIRNPAIARALTWLLREGAPLGVRAVNLSLGGDVVDPLAGNEVDRAVAALVRAGVTVIVAAGNDGVRRLVPPGTAPDAITVGGLDDRSLFTDAERTLWHSNYGAAAADNARAGALPKPELVAPSLRVVAPILPGTGLATEAAALFARRARNDASAEPRLAELKLVTPHYQHVEGTSFAAPIVTSLVATMLEANPDLTPARVRTLLLASATRVPGAPADRQGAGAIDAGRAVGLASADSHVVRT